MDLNGLLGRGGARDGQAWDGLRTTLGSFLAGRPEKGVILGVVAVFVGFSISADNFLTTASLASTLTITAELAIVAMAVTLLMIAGEFDLSVGSVLGVSAVLVPYLIVDHDVAPALALVISFMAAVAIGFIQGTIIVVSRIPSFILTLGGLLFWRGIVFVITGGLPILVPAETGVFDPFSHRFSSGFNVSAFWFVGLAIVLSFVLTHMKWGNWIFAAGGNERAARGMGVPVDRLRLALFTLTAASAGLVGIIQTGRFSSVDANRGLNLELEAIAAAVIGGARLNGGYGSVIGTALGCLVLGMIRNGLVLAGVASYWYPAMVGVLIVVAVFVNQLLGGVRLRRA
jgi:simple sugar transport system permease protein